MFFEAKNSEMLSSQSRAFIFSLESMSPAHDNLSEKSCPDLALFKFLMPAGILEPILSMILSTKLFIGLVVINAYFVWRPELVLKLVAQTMNKPNGSMRCTGFVG